jgi:hypothetical protein
MKSAEREAIEEKEACIAIDTTNGTRDNPLAVWQETKSSALY